MGPEEDTQMETDEVDWRVNQLQFDDGGMRGLAVPFVGLG